MPFQTFCGIITVAHTLIPQQLSSDIHVTLVNIRMTYKPSQSFRTNFTAGTYGGHLLCA